MEKLIFLLYQPTVQPLAAEFTQRMLSEVLPRLQTAGASGIVFNVADLNDAVRVAAPARVAGDWDNVAGALHFWIDNVDDRARFSAIIAELAPRHAAYLVTESLVQKTPRTWGSGERRPGVTQLAVIRKAPDVNEDAFYHNWQQGHSVLSFQLHPLRVSYVRNDVARVLTPGAERYRIIVLEHWAELRDFTDDARYFGAPEVLEEMYRELPGFADVHSTTTGPVSEYCVD